MSARLSGLVRGKLGFAMLVARFGMVGVFVTALNYLAFIGLQRAGWHYLVAATTAWVVSVAVNFILSLRVTFRMKRRGELRELGLFVGGNLAQLGAGLGLYWLLIGALRVSPSTAFVCNTAIMAAASFIFMRCVVFRRAAPVAAVS